MDDIVLQRPFNGFPPGRIIADRYEILEPVGRGGMGLVVKARDLKNENRIVAIKILDPELFEDPTLRARFEREAEVGQKLQHPNIVQVHDFGEIKGETRFICMEFVEGESLAAKLKQCAPNGLLFSDTVSYFSQIVAGLAHAHAQEIIHRDVTPGNILITKTGKAKIADFGIARLLVTAQRLTRTFESIGTRHYMPPEQLLGGKVDMRSDIYTLGITAHEMATGTPEISKYRKETKQKTATSPEIPKWFNDLIVKATQTDPDERFQSLTQISKVLRKKIGVHDATTEPFSPRNERFIYRLHPSHVCALLLLVILVAAGGFYFFANSR